MSITIARLQALQTSPPVLTKASVNNGSNGIDYKPTATDIANAKGTAPAATYQDNYAPVLAQIKTDKAAGKATGFDTTKVSVTETTKLLNDIKTGKDAVALTQSGAKLNIEQYNAVQLLAKNNQSLVSLRFAVQAGLNAKSTGVNDAANVIKAYDVKNGITTGVIYQGVVSKTPGNLINKTA